MSRLKNYACYLAGPIDESPDRGVDWRVEITQFLHELDIGVFNPCDKPTEHNEDASFVELVKQYKSIGRYNKVAELVKPIISQDLHMVDLSNFVILHVDKRLHMCGSYSEITYAALEHKTCLIHCEQSIGQIPSWLFGLCDPSMFFDKWEDLKEYIVHINKSIGEVPGWRFIDYSKVWGHPTPR
jgi:hypothetical protein